MSDIAFDVVYMADRINTSTVEYLKELNKVIKKVKSDNVSLKYQNLDKNLVIHFLWMHHLEI